MEGVQRRTTGGAVQKAKLLDDSLNCSGLATESHRQTPHTGEINSNRLSRERTTQTRKPYHQPMISRSVMKASQPPVYSGPLQQVGLAGPADGLLSGEQRQTPVKSMIAMAMSNSSRSPNPPSFLPQYAPLGLGDEPLRVRYSNLPCRSIRWPSVFRPVTRRYWKQLGVVLINQAGFT